MQYNSSRDKMIMREYGRHVQEMVEQAAKIEDKKKRNEQIQLIIELMGIINPHLKNVEDFKHKLYDHIYIMADYKIDVESPYPIPQREIIEKKPEPLPYPKHQISFKHYGKNVERMVEKAKFFDHKEKQQEYLLHLANYMKLVHTNWNKEVVSDEVIREDLKRLSGHTLELAADSEIQEVKANIRNFRDDERDRRSKHGKRHRNNKGSQKKGSNNFKRK